ncbi:hypothetical protein [Bradyrhizobium sp. 33ap4]|uniref:hypothetical protein n=1 Tax=Bradyrhizobium sp. 33ap4 TaxID=3061630 RepID=UPI0029305E33|nr:hypothetical protein [Bradyrhizobium sp. 33ap4]
MPSRADVRFSVVAVLRSVSQLGRTLAVMFDLLMPYGDVVMALSVVLRIKRTLDGAEIDQIIRDVEAQKALAVERRRRADWRKREEAAKRFRAACVP